VDSYEFIHNEGDVQSFIRYDDVTSNAEISSSIIKIINIYFVLVALLFCELAWHLKMCIHCVVK